VGVEVADACDELMEISSGELFVDLGVLGIEEGLEIAIVGIFHEDVGDLLELAVFYGVLLLLGFVKSDDVLMIEVLEVDFVGKKG